MIRVGILDSGIGTASGLRVCARAVFPRGEAAVADGADALGHGTQVATIIARAAPQAEFLDARIFLAALRTGAVAVAAGIDWLCDAGACMVNMSVGLREDRAVLREACARALSRGVVLVASSPARGAPVFPASYPGVIRATGDARCAPGEISFLGTAQADFGAHVRAPDGCTAGASIGCAHLSGAIASLLAAQPRLQPAQLRAELQRMAVYHGPERRS